MFFLLPLFSLFLFWMSSCSVGPDYHPPAAETSAAYKEGDSWKVATPRDEIAKGNWWEVFHDPKLNELEMEATQANQSLRVAMYNVTQARAQARATQAEFFPSLYFNPDYVRRRVSPNTYYSPVPAPASTSASANGTPVPTNPPAVSTAHSAATFNDFQVPFDLSYEVDIWGRVRRMFEAAKAQAQATEAAFETILLTLKADVALDYFNLRFLDSQREVLQKTVELRKEALDLINARFNGGVASEIDLTEAQTELATAQAQEYALDRSRAEVEHALAVLLGKPPASFSFPMEPIEVNPPEIPPGLPSALLERRPDIAQAERQMAASNAQIGVAVAAFFPVVTLTGTAGYESASVNNLFSWNSHIWSYGPSISLPVFLGGQNMANLKGARAAYEASVANYRQQVLVAFQEVEDSLSDLHHLANQYEALNRAEKSSHRASELSMIRYKSGLVNYLEVVDSERTELDSQLQAVQIQGQRLGATVQLVKALGGGWKDSLVVPAASTASK